MYIIWLIWFCLRYHFKKILFKNWSSWYSYLLAGNFSCHSLSCLRHFSASGLFLLLSRLKQVCKTRTCLSRLASLRHTDDLRSTCVDLRWVAKQLKTCVNLRTNSSAMQVNVSGWWNEPQVVERKSKTCVDLRVRWARALLDYVGFN